MAMPIALSQLAFTTHIKENYCKLYNRVVSFKYNKIMSFKSSKLK